ncbi:MAG: aminodeoxychorismate/anthranilate synthase component II [Fibrobacteria bacterium]|nr:aminodeoxychorismate/anthranilate synthase component II [Fibrobacteria bacterium]
MILVIDNYDSFTYNLVQFIGEINPDMEIVRNNKAKADDLLAKKPSHVIISPGPCTPKEAGISVEVIQKTPAHTPLLGVCLGHQSIGAAYGGDVILAPYIMHGKVSTVTCMPSPLFKDMDNSFTATRYHSLIVKRETLPSELKVIAETEDGIIMGMQHVSKPVFGLQFHPESILTGPGKTIIKNFLNIGDSNDK